MNQKSKHHKLILILIIGLIFTHNYNINCQHSSCFSHQSCSVSSNLSSKSQTHQTLPPTSSPLIQCSCNSTICHIYGDCCTEVKLNKALLSLSNYSCLSIPTSERLIAIQAISKCSKLWSDTQIKSICEDPKSERDLLLTVPVTNNITHITYKNIFCAVCNFDVENSVPWKANTLCRIKDSNSCILSFEVPFLESLYHCTQPKVIDSCSQDSVSFEHKLNCSLYLDPVRGLKGFEHETYKNYYCALCNNITQLSCPEASWTTFGTPGTPRDVTYSFSFSVILDIDIKGKVGNKCDATHIYDPWKKMCRRVFCDKNSELIDGKCIQQNNTINNINKTNDFDICPKIYFELQEYENLTDGSVYLTENNMIYNKSEYMIDSTTNKLIICITTDTTERSDSYLTIVCLTISIISLSIKISHFFIRPETRRISSILVLYLSFSLFFAQTLFLFGLHRNEFAVICELIAIIMHYFFLCSFFWMNVLSYDIYRTFASMLRSKHTRLFNRQLIVYTIYGWTLPFIITCAAVVVNHSINSDNSGISPGYGTTYCWISNRLALTVFLGAPLAILLIINTVLLMLTAFKITETSAATRFVRENINQRRERFRFILYIKLATIMGSTWIVGFIAAYAQNAILWDIFSVLNSLQGLYVLLAFTRCPKSDLLLCCRSGSDRINSNKSLSTSTTNVQQLTNTSKL